MSAEPLKSSSLASPTDLFRTPKWTGWTAAVAVTLLAAFLASRLFSLRAHYELQRTEAELSRLEADSLRQQLEAERILAWRQLNDLRNAAGVGGLRVIALRPITIDETAPSGLAASLAWAPAVGRGLVIAQGLPTLTSGHSYALRTADGQVLAERLAFDQSGLVSAALQIAERANSTANPTFELVRIADTNADAPAGADGAEPVVLLRGSAETP